MFPPVIMICYKVRYFRTFRFTLLQPLLLARPLPESTEFGGLSRICHSVLRLNIIGNQMSVCET
jgi:hypothetical protein